MRRARRAPAITPEGMVQQQISQLQGVQPKWAGGTGWITLTLNAPFANTFGTAEYKKTAYGFVVVRGYINNGVLATSGTTFATLPAGFRPGGSAQAWRYQAGGTSGGRDIQIDISTSTGNMVMWYSGAALASQNFALDTIFLAEN